MKCPKCGSDQLPSTTRCDCGYDFSKEAQNQPAGKENGTDRVSSDLETVAKGEASARNGAGKRILFLVLGILLLLMAPFVFAVIILGGVEAGLAQEPYRLIFAALILGMLSITGGVFFLYKAFGSPAVDDKAIRLYSWKNIVGAAFFGGPLASAYLMSENFKNLGSHLAARRSLLVGFISTLLLFGGLILIPKEITERIPNYLIPLATMAVVAYLVHTYQGRQIRERFEGPV